MPAAASNTATASAPSPAPKPSRNTLPPCDLVMKGGITSGIVYPPALQALSDKYRFEQIGGTSAGAIAAACAAAAEFGEGAEDCPGPRSRLPGSAGFGG